MSELKRTPLFESYKKYGGKTIDFGGWELPVQFSGIKQEHEAVRTKAGLFDVSHMGEITVEGPESLAYLQRMLTNDVSKLKTGQAQYTVLCYEDGGTVDDLLVYKLTDERYLLVVNAANIEKDFDWLKAHAQDGAEVVNRSEEYGQLAFQGPLAESVLQRLTDTDLTDIKFFRFQENVDVAGRNVLVSRTGYTGEDGFEIYGSPEDIIALWGAILEEGKEDGAVPVGLGARDTLRFEACLALYGQELTKDISPLEAGIGFAVKLKKDADFIGKEALLKQKEEGIVRKLTGLEMLDKGIPRPGYKVFKDGEEIGHVTTGTQSPTLGKNIGLALVGTEFTEPGTEVEVEVRNRRLKAVTVETPFYKRSTNS
ncbi:glycine cleavage system aminomethyltransferase GcvT [Planococcus lenghuensis]|uniref:Aminomethyltransferase n=1 Tax=Planococcus lenghuensis TaxID=2213202 RepID=A0A1Q2KXT3_9BACL|nr:glycine cleavage system aminomethyltransferase GcvT [Planococcus lenghuensis]AQQ53011.1 glycine cleavage system protein T [Planococcus lenghuensis]